jgi:hypothetical protein
MNLIFEHWTEIALGLIAFGNVIANITKTPKDNAILSAAYKLVNFFALNWTKKSSE